MPAEICYTVKGRRAGWVASLVRYGVRSMTRKSAACACLLVCLGLVGRCRMRGACRVSSLPGSLIFVKDLTERPPRFLVDLMPAFLVKTDRRGDGSGGADCAGGRLVRGGISLRWCAWLAVSPSPP